MSIEGRHGSYRLGDHLGIVRRAEDRRLPWGEVTHFDRRYFETMAEWLRGRLAD